MLKLRGREDANTVKITYSGMAKLLGVNIKTAHRCVKGLVSKGFIFFQEDLKDPGCYYSKKLYTFPETFPDFDLKTVFIKRGAKSSASPQRTAGGENKSKHFAGVNFHHEELKWLLLDFLRSNKLERNLLMISRFFNSLCDQCAQYKTVQDRQEVAAQIYEYLPPVMVDNRHKRNVLAYLLDWIQLSVEQFCPSAVFNGPEYMELIRMEAKGRRDDLAVAVEQNRMPYVPQPPEQGTKARQRAALAKQNQRTEVPEISYVYPNLLQSKGFAMATVALQQSATSSRKAPEPEPADKQLDYHFRHIQEALDRDPPPSYQRRSFAP